MNPRYSEIMRLFESFAFIDLLRKYKPLIIISLLKLYNLKSEIMIREIMKNYKKIREIIKIK